MGLQFEVVVPRIDERHEGDEPEGLVLANARAKAAAARARCGPEAVVVAADTDVIIDGTLLGQPAGAAAAAGMLRRLSNRSHEVLTAVVVLGAGGEGERSGTERTEVTFRELDDLERDAYIACGEWRGCAGGYAIQGLGASLVEAVQGDLSNVIGLPVALLRRLLARA